MILPVTAIAVPKSGLLSAFGLGFWVVGEEIFIAMATAAFGE